ncbi:MAG: PDZ domain-containing protein [Anaerolineales bacterium]|nr:PDZ domain-containing protein [Anaerolineales bacterium]
MLKRLIVHTGLVLAALLAAACGLVQRTPPTATPVPTIAATERQLTVFDAAWEAVRDQYVRADYGGVNWDAVRALYRPKMQAGLSDGDFALTLRAMLAALPNNQAVYQTRAERLAQETTDSTTYHGIGAFIAFRQTPAPHVVILAVVEDSPAQRAGLAPHDNILAINGAPFTLEDEASPAEKIRGLPDTSVTLTVQTPGSDPREVTIAREQITATDVLRGGYLESLNLAYYRVPVASSATLADNLAADLDQIAQSATPAGVIIDLRVARSGGGWPLTNMLALFGDGALGEFYTRDSSEQLTLAGVDVGGSQTLPLVLLVGPDTEGSPEIFAAALQASGRAVVIGQATPGSVEGFEEVALPDGSRLFLATSSFRTTANADLATSGLTPDQVVAADWDSFPPDADPVIDAALQELLGSAP